MQPDSQEIVIEIFEFLSSDFGLHGPVKSNIAYENHLTYSGDKYRIDFSDEGNWDFPFITIQNKAWDYLPIPDDWFEPKGLQAEIANDFGKQRSLDWLSKVDKKTLDSSNYPLTENVISSEDDSFQSRGRKIVAVYLLLVADILKTRKEEIPTQLENPILKKIKNYLQHLLSK